MKILLITLAVIALLVVAVWMRSPLQLWILDRLARLWGKHKGYMHVQAVDVIAQLRHAPRFTGLVDFFTGKRMRGTSTRAVTIARTVLFRDPPPFPIDLIRHERKHVEQWVTRGWYAATKRAEEEAETAEHTATPAT